MLKSRQINASAYFFSFLYGSVNSNYYIIWGEIMSDKSYQQIIRELREDRDLSQADVAKVHNTTQQMYSRYENGECELPIRHLKTLCGFYEVNTDYILSLKTDQSNK